MKIHLILILSTCLFSNEIDRQKLLELDKKNKALFAEVKNYTDKLIKNKGALIKEKLEEFADNPEAFNGNEINKAVKDAMVIAKANGLDTVKLQKMFELSKKVILRSEFKKYDGDSKSATAKKFDEWLNWAILGEEKIARDTAMIQEQRVALYKKVNLAFIRALIEKDIQKSYDSFRKYAQALQKIQSADADVLVAEAEALVAEQKLLNDVVVGIPLLGDALDIMAIYNGEDLSGTKLNDLEKGVSVLMLVTPNILEQLIKRNPPLAVALGKVAAKLDAFKEAAKENVSRLASKKNISNVTALLKGNRDIDVWRLNHYQKIKEQQKLAELTKDKLDELLVKSAKELDDLKLVKQGDPKFAKKAVFSKEILDSISGVAKKRDEIIITRPVNTDAQRWIDQGASTKDMFVKGKSAERTADNGIFAGLIPEKQKYSKLDKANEIDEFQAKVNKSLSGETSYVNYSKKDFKDLEVKLSKGEISQTKYDEIISRETATPMVGSKQLEVMNSGKKYSAVELPKKGANKYTEGKVVYKNNGKYFDEHFNEISKSNLKKYDLDKELQFKVLTDTKGNLLTADLDLLTVGSKKKATVMQNDYTMGNINSNEMATAFAINKKTKKSQYPDQQLVHHGGESSFINKQSKPDYPLMAHSQSGTVMLENEKQLKAYYHSKKLKGYDLEPNPFWNWGEWDPEFGYK